MQQQNILGDASIPFRQYVIHEAHFYTTKRTRTEPVRVVAARVCLRGRMTGATNGMVFRAGDGSVRGAAAAVCPATFAERGALFCTAPTVADLTMTSAAAEETHATRRSCSRTASQRVSVAGRKVTSDIPTHCVTSVVDHFPDRMNQTFGAQLSEFR